MKTILKLNFPNLFNNEKRIKAHIHILLYIISFSILIISTAFIISCSSRDGKYVKPKIEIEANLKITLKELERTDRKVRRIIREFEYDSEQHSIKKLEEIEKKRNEVCAHTKKEIEMIPTDVPDNWRAQEIKNIYERLCLTPVKYPYW